jgi:hypothetical protein
MIFMEKAVMVSLPLLFVFQFFLTASFFQLNCPSVGRTGCPPSVNKGIKGPSLLYLPATFLQKAAAVSLPPLFIISPSIPIFSQSFFFPKLLISQPYRPPSHNQLRDQRPIAAIPSHNLPAEGSGREFSPPFYFSLTIPIISHGFFFAIILLFSWPRRPPSLSQ